jgi:hypothetical protein
MSEENKSDISRREFLKDAGLCAGCAAIGGAALLSGCAGQTQTETVTTTNTTTVTSPPVTKTVQTTITAAPAAVSLELFNPAGNQEISQLFAPRLSTLDGKTVAFLACDPTKWQPHRIFPVIMEELKKLYPTINFLPMDQFTMGGAISDDATIKAVADKKPHAVITGCAA